MSLDTLAKGEQALLHLLRIHLWHESPDVKFLGGLSQDDWTLCYRLACMQGVRALAFEALLQLPEGLDIPGALSMRWCESTERLYSRNRECMNVLASLVRECTAAGLEPVLLKGAGIASLYPQPLSRECGDIDLWFPGKSSDADNWFREMGYDVIPPDMMHSKCIYKGFEIENHYSLFRRGKPKNRHVEPAAMCLWRKEGGRLLPLAGGASIMIPGPGLQLLHNARHIISHLTERFVLRNIVDWALLLLDCDKEDKRQEVRGVFNQVGFSRAIAVVEALAVEYLGMPREMALFMRGGEGRLVERLYEKMLRPTPKYIEGRGPIIYFIARWRHFNEPYCLYRLIYGMSYPHYVARKFCYQARENLKKRLI